MPDDGDFIHHLFRIRLFGLKKKKQVSVKGLPFAEILALFYLKKQCVPLFTAAVTEYQRLDNLQ